MLARSPWPVLVPAVAIWMVALPIVVANTPESNAGKRFALVVGNADYRSVNTLRNPANDALAVSATLHDLGVEVITLINGTRAEMDAAIERLDNEAVGAEATLFYYAGHGFQLSGNNYLVPVDAELQNREEIDRQTVRLDDIIVRLQAMDRQTLIILDACRENPLPSGDGTELADGLAQIQIGYGIYIAFATQPGNVAYDGEGEHSPFADALIENLPAAGISVSDLMIRVRNEVQTVTDQRQQPWETSSLRSQFYFNPEVERVASLSEQDLALLTGLSPELQAQFEQMWGYEITPPSNPHPTAADPDVSRATEPMSPMAVEPTEPLQMAAIDVQSGAAAESISSTSSAAVVSGTTLAVGIAPGAAMPAGSPALAMPVGATGTVAAVEASAVIVGTEVQAGFSPIEPTLPIDLAGATVGLPVIGLPVPPALEPQGPAPRDLATAVQTELSRLGCYRNAIDGIWGQFSSRALLRYFATRKVAPLGKDPSPEIYAMLMAEPLVVCRQTQPTVADASTVTVVEVKPTANQRPTFKTSPPRSPGAAAPPPDQQSPIRITPGLTMF